MGETLKNFLVINLQKLELELKCHSCFNLLTNPVCLPCNHMFCSHCVAVSSNKAECAICLVFFTPKDVKPAARIDSIVNICRDMCTALGTNVLKQGPQVKILDSKTPSSQSPESGKSDGSGVSEEPVNGMFRRTAGNLLYYDPSKQDKERTEEFNGAKKHFDNQHEPCSPPPSAEEYGSNDKGSERKNKRSLEEELPKDGQHACSEPKNMEDQEPQRHKLDSESNLVNLKSDSTCEDVTGVNSKAQHEDRQLHLLYSSGTSVMECAFCHSSRDTQASGQMLHYLNGTPIFGAEVFQSNVEHVHQKCIEWAPQVYFEGDTAMNLTAEVSRAAKIKCSQCGKKGAALGCYVRSCRRSFHVPCAFEVPKCRWDYDNFVVLCPTHSSNKLPFEKSRKKKKLKTNSSSSDEMALEPNSDENYETAEQDVSPKTSSRPVLCGSFLSSEDKEFMQEFANLIGARLENGWKENVTHVIASTDEYGGCTRSFKFLMGILKGKWILKIDWVKACLEAANLVPEEPYEIEHDIHGCFGGPKNGRIRAIKKEAKLFSGLSFYLSGYYMPYYKDYLENLIAGGGGSMLQKPDLKCFEDKNSKHTSQKIYVVYSMDPPQGCDPDDLPGVIKKRTDEAEAVAAKIGAVKTIPHIWILDTVAVCSLPEN